MWDYSEKVMDHFLHPRNVGEVKNPDAVGQVGNITCGDALRLTLRIDKGEHILDAKFQSFGCGSAIASSSALTELIMGKTLAEASKITNKDIADYLDGLPEEKMHCSVMGMEALEAAISNFRGLRADDVQTDRGEIVCKCFGVTDTRIERVVRENGLKSIEEVTNYVKAGGGCKGCHDQIQAIIDKAQAAIAAESAKHEPVTRPMTNLERMQKVMQCIEREIRPSLQADGGDIQLVDIEGKRVIVALRGSCSGCSAANLTLKNFVEAKLRESIEPDIVVEAA
jgi:NifU-like protein